MSGEKADCLLRTLFHFKAHTCDLSELELQKTFWEQQERNGEFVVVVSV